jgi:hypothetical protein
LLPYRWGFGVNVSDPTQPDLAEPIQFLSLLESLNISLVNLTAGSPYYNPHVQRPALYPPSDGYAPPEDPLVGVARQMNAARELKRRFPNLLFVGTAYSYLQDFLPHVAHAARWLGRLRRVGADGFNISGNLSGCGAGARGAAQTDLPDVQRLHHGSAERIAFGLLSAGRALQELRGRGAVGGAES